MFGDPIDDDVVIPGRVWPLVAAVVVAAAVVVVVAAATNDADSTTEGGTVRRLGYEPPMFVATTAVDDVSLAVSAP